MKAIKLASTLSILSLFLCSCITYDWSINDSKKYNRYIGNEVVSSKKLYVYKRPWGAEKYSKYALRDVFVDNSKVKEEDYYYIFLLIEEIPPGKPFRILEARRERGGDGHVWDHLIWQVTIESTKEELIFVYLVGLSDENKQLPFDLVKK